MGLLFECVQNSVSVKDYRAIKAAGGNTTHFVYDLMGNIIAEAAGAGAIQREYVYVNAERLALLQQSPTQAIYYYHNDHLGTPKALTNASGTVVWQADYTPFGELIETVSIVAQPFRFPGQYFDSETGLHYNYFRTYDPAIGRYLQSDPIGLKGGINTYGYALQNPFKYTDPNGLAPCPPGMVPPGTPCSLDDGSGNDDGGYLDSSTPYCPSGDCAVYPPTHSDGNGPFGLVCGPSQSPPTASWIPDGIWENACAAHDACYGTCGKTKGECDREFLINSGNAAYFGAVSVGAQSAYDEAQAANGCDCNE